MSPRLTADEIASALAQLPGWTLSPEGKLHREYRFADFVHAFAFMAAAAPGIEARNHHPEWSNVWSRVTIGLTTHDAGGLTAKDVELARFLESLAARFLA